MVWGQGLGADQVIDPKMAYQGFMLPQHSQDLSDSWNGCTIQQARIIHWHGSRGANEKLNLMASVNQQLNIPDTPIRNITERTIDISEIK